MKEALQEIVGVDTVAAALDELPAQIRDAFEPITPMTWVHLAVVTAVVDQVAKHARRPFDELMDEAVRRAAERTLRTPWRMLLRLTSDRALMLRTPILYAKWRNVGRLEVRSIERGNSDLILSEWPGVSERSVRTLAITIETVLRLSGRRQIKIEWESTPDGARYSVRWRP